jgi:hypothetical protein
LAEEAARQRTASATNKAGMSMFRSVHRHMALRAGVDRADPGSKR